jgi:hypothetical protein
VFIVLLRYGGYFGKKETPFAATASPAEAFIGLIAFHFQVGGYLRILNPTFT